MKKTTMGLLGFGLLASVASAQDSERTAASRLIPIDASDGCYAFGPMNTRQNFFLGRDTKVLLRVIGGGGGGGGNTGFGGGGGEAGRVSQHKEIELTKGLYFVQVGAGGTGGRGKRPPFGEPGDDATAGGRSQVNELGGPFAMVSQGGAGGKVNAMKDDVQGENGRSVVDGSTVISEGGRGGDRDRHGSPGQTPGAGGGGTGAFVAGGGLIGGSGGDGEVILCVYERGALTSMAGGRRLQ